MVPVSIGDGRMSVIQLFIKGIFERFNAGGKIKIRDSPHTYLSTGRLR